MLIQKTLRVGDGAYSTPISRRAERLFGEKATGRSKVVKVEWTDSCSYDPAKYDPSSDCCLDAYVRMLAARALKDVGGVVGTP